MRSATQITNHDFTLSTMTTITHPFALLTTLSETGPLLSSKFNITHLMQNESLIKHLEIFLTHISINVKVFGCIDSLCKCKIVLLLRQSASLPSRCSHSYAIDMKLVLIVAKRHRLILNLLSNTVTWISLSQYRQCEMQMK